MVQLFIPRFWPFSGAFRCHRRRYRGCSGRPSGGCSIPCRHKGHRAPLKEIREAIQAGERALYSLREAERQLGSARNWGVVDIFGGNMVSGMMKHMKVNNASRCVDDARRDLAAFRDELGDIRDIENLRIDIDGFLTFADFFFDGFIADVFVQSRIRRGQQQVQEAIRRVEDILRTLRRV